MRETLEFRIPELRATIALREQQIAAQAEVLNEKDQRIATLTLELTAAQGHEKELRAALDEINKLEIGDTGPDESLAISGMDCDYCVKAHKIARAALAK